MNYIQNGIEFNFSKPQDEDTWFCSFPHDDLTIEIHINASLFGKKIFMVNTEIFDWETVKLFTEHIMKNITFFYEKVTKWSKELYNGIGWEIEQNNNFEKENGAFEGAIFITLQRITSSFQYDKNNGCLS